MEERIIFVLWPGDNKWEKGNSEKHETVPGPMNEWNLCGEGFLFWRDSRWNKNYKDDGEEYYIYEEVDVDDDDDFYGGEFMLGDIWEDE